MLAVRAKASGSSGRGRLRVWLDAHLSPRTAKWLSATYSSVDAASIPDLGLQFAEDEEIVFAARGTAACVMTKDRDFAELLQRHGKPPVVIWVTCGNTNNAGMQEILARTWTQAHALIEAGEALIEIADAPTIPG